MRAHDDPDRAAHPRELLDGDGVRERVETRAADLLGIGNAEQAQRGSLADDLHRELALPLEVVGDRGDPLRREVAHGATDLLVLRREGEVHGFLRSV